MGRVAVLLVLVLVTVMFVKESYECAGRRGSEGAKEVTWKCKCRRNCRGGFRCSAPSGSSPHCDCDSCSCSKTSRPKKRSVLDSGKLKLSRPRKPS